MKEALEWACLPFGTSACFDKVQDMERDIWAVCAENLFMPVLGGFFATSEDVVFIMIVELLCNG